VNNEIQDEDIYVGIDASDPLAKEKSANNKTRNSKKRENIA